MIDYGFFIKKLPSELVELINSFVNPKTDYYRELLKERVKTFCLNGLFRIEENGIMINHSYFHIKEVFDDFHKIEKYKINIDKNIDQILKVRDTFKQIYKPMKRKTNTLYHLKHVIEEINNIYVSKGIMTMALLLLGVRYKKERFNDTSPVFYCGVKDDIKKIIKTLYILEDNAIKRIKNYII